MLTKDEIVCLDKLTEFWNLFVELDPEGRRSADNEAMARDVHNMQHRIMARSARRDHPKLFRP